MKYFQILLVAFLLWFPMEAQENKNSPILFIYDASGSMWGQLDGKTKKEIGAEVMAQAVNNLGENQEIGLMAYGHRRKGDCEDVETLVQLENKSKANIIKAVNGINPLGKTPLAHSATLAIEDLKRSKKKATIILVTDGIESCDGNICDVVLKAKEAGIEFKLHIVGFGLKEGETEQLKCAAEAGGGNYYDVADAGGLGEVLTEATSTTIDDPDPNFSVFATKNGEPVDAWVRAFEPGTKNEIAYARTYQDSGFLYLPTGKYELQVQALENTDLDPIVLLVEKKEDVDGHQDVSFDGGKIRVFTSNNGEGWDSVVSIYVDGARTNTSGGRTYGNTVEYEVNAGTYVVELNILRLKGSAIEEIYKEVKVMANETTDVTHDFKSGIALIGFRAGDELVDSTINIVDVATGKSVAGSRTYTSPSNNPKEFLLNPGTYEVTAKSLGKHKGKTVSSTIVVKQGETVTKIFDY